MQRYAKGLAALLGVLVEGALLLWGDELGIDADALPAVLTAITALTGFGVYRVPNTPPGATNGSPGP